MLATLTETLTDLALWLTVEGEILKPELFTPLACRFIFIRGQDNSLFEGGVTQAMAKTPERLRRVEDVLGMFKSDV